MRVNNTAEGRAMYVILFIYNGADDFGNEDDVDDEGNAAEM